MEKAAVAGASAGSRKELRLGACFAVVACAAWLPAWAQDAATTPVEAMLAETRPDPAVRVQVQTSSLPRLAAQEFGFHAPRVDVSLVPARAGGLGAVVGMSGFTSQQGLHVPGRAPVRPSLDLGVRFSHTLQSQQIDITAWRRMNTEPDAYTLVQMRQPVYGARVEMRLTPKRKSGIAADLGFIGLQLESGARISIKRKDGRPMIYYRTTF